MAHDNSEGSVDVKTVSLGSVVDASCKWYKFKVEYIKRTRSIEWFFWMASVCVHIRKRKNTDQSSCKKNLERRLKEKEEALKGKEKQLS